MAIQETMTVPLELSFNLISTLAGRSESDFENVRKYINKGFSSSSTVYWAGLTAYHREVSFGDDEEGSELQTKIKTVNRLSFYDIIDKESHISTDLPQYSWSTTWTNPRGLEFRVVDPQGNIWEPVSTLDDNYVKHLVMQSVDSTGNIHMVPYEDESLNQYKVLIYSVNPDKVDPLYYHLRYKPIDTTAPVSSVRMRDTLVNLTENISPMFRYMYDDWRPYVSYNVVDDVYYLWGRTEGIGNISLKIKTIDDYDTDDVIPQGSRVEVFPDTMFYKLLTDNEMEYPTTETITAHLAEIKPLLPTDTYNLDSVADDLVLYGEVTFSRFRELMTTGTLELSGYKELMNEIPALEPLAKLAIGSYERTFQWNIMTYQPPLTFYLNGANYERFVDVPFNSRIFNPIEYFQQSSVDQDVALFGEDTAGGIPKDKLELYIDTLESEDYETQLYDASNYVEEDS